MSDFFGKVKRRLAGGQATGQKLKHEWRMVREGPLKGIYLYLPSGEHAGWAERFLTGGYEPETVAAVAIIARGGGTLYDIGAHIGYYTCAWLMLGGDFVDAFEPAPYNREILRATIEKNGFGDRVQIHSTAIGDREGEATLLASSIDVGAASAAYLQEFGEVNLPPEIEAAPLAGVEPTAVSIRTLSSLAAEMKLPPPTAIKLDIEGAEWAALVGAHELLEREHPAIICEVHGADVAVLISDKLAHMGYVPHILGKNGPHVAVMWDRDAVT